MPADIPPPFVCEVVRVHDGDGPLWCADGRKVRVAGVQAPDRENTQPCRRRKAGYVCSNLEAALSQQRAVRLTLGKRLVCHQVDRSYKRVVATCTLPDGRSLSCALIASEAATRWDSYWRRYRMGECR